GAGSLDAVADPLGDAVVGGALGVVTADPSVVGADLEAVANPAVSTVALPATCCPHAAAARATTAAAMVNPRQFLIRSPSNPCARLRFHPTQGRRARARPSPRRYLSSRRVLARSDERAGSRPRPASGRPAGRCAQRPSGCGPRAAAPGPRPPVGPPPPRSRRRPAS